MINNNAEHSNNPGYHGFLAIAFLAGFVCLSYEIVATKILYYFFNESTITASSVISIFLFGIGIGSFTFGKFEKKISDKKKFVLKTQLLIACYAVLIFPNFNIIPYLFNLIHPSFGDSATMLMLSKLIVSFFYLIFPTILMGMVFPAIIVMSVDKIEQLPEKIGVINGFDLFGAVLGALLSGFLFIPFWGIKTLIFLSALINLLICLLIFFQKTKRFILLVMGFVFVAFLFYLIINPFDSSAKVHLQKNVQEKYISRDNLLFRNESDPKYFQKVKIKEKKFFSHSPFGELSVFDEVFDNQQHRFLYIETRVQCSTVGLKEKQVSEINFVNESINSINNNQMTVLNIGLGCGFTSSEIARNPKVKTVDVVEINPLMPEATKCFSEFTDNVLENPKVNIIFNDGYSHLLGTGKKYDLIIMDIEHPSVIYSSNLYTLEFYRLVEKALKKDGLFTQWSYRPLPDAQIINYNTLKTVFPQVSPKISGTFHDLYYIAGHKDFPMDEREKSFLNRMLSTNDKRLNTLNNPYFGTEMMLRELFKVN